MPTLAGDTSSVRTSAGRARRRRALHGFLALLLLMPQLTGCYHYVTVADPQIPAGARVSMDVTDRGRVALAERIGPGVRRLGGSLVSSNDTALVLSLSSVDFIDVPVPVRWSGEQVFVSRALLSEVREQRFSRPRTILLAGVVALAVVGASTLALTGWGSSKDGETSGEGNSGQ